MFENTILTFIVYSNTHFAAFFKISNFCSFLHYPGFNTHVSNILIIFLTITAHLINFLILRFVGNIRRFFRDDASRTSEIVFSPLISFRHFLYLVNSKTAQSASILPRTSPDKFCIFCFAPVPSLDLARSTLSPSQRGGTRGAYVLDFGSSQRGVHDSPVKTVSGKCLKRICRSRLSSGCRRKRRPSLRSDLTGEQPGATGANRKFIFWSTGSYIASSEFLFFFFLFETERPRVGGACPGGSFLEKV